MSSLKKLTVAVESLGCKLNQAEAQYLERQLAAAGYRLVAPEDGADIYVLNTCTVTHIADRKSRHLLRLARRRNPDVRLVATGCYAERAPREIAKIEGVELVLDNDLKESLVERLNGLKKPDVTRGTPRTGARTRAFIKVQEGCRGACAYCIVPQVRGPEKSVPVDTVLARIGERIADVCREAVLTGTEIGRYNYEGVELKGMVRRILEETSIQRLRLSSLQPPEVDAGLIDLWRDPRLCPHFHLSLQSGSNGVLGRMNRRYTTEDYLDCVSLIRQTVPEAAITTDIIVGFPGETEDELHETLDFCRRVGFARVHVFPYSPRPGTVAASLPGQIAEPIKKTRTGEALSTARECARRFQKQFLGRTMDVLWEKETGGIWSGLTGNYIKVYTRNPSNLANQFLSVELERFYRDGLWGRFT